MTGQRLDGSGQAVVLGQAPLAELNGYQTRLNSLTGGQGRYTIAFSHHAAVPPAVQQQLAAAFKMPEPE